MTGVPWWLWPPLGLAGALVLAFVAGALVGADPWRPWGAVAGGVLLLVATVVVVVAYYA